MTTATSPPPRRLTQGLQVAAWIESNCVFTQAQWYGQPFRLLPWQRELLCELFEVDGSGARKHRWAYLSVPKKNGKTELAAALALWFLLGSGEPSPLVVCAAGSDDQADLVFGAAKTMCEESPTLKVVTERFEDVIVVPSIPGARLQRVSASSRRHSSNLDGKNVFVVIADELHCWEGERGRIVWGTLTRGTIARRQPMVIQTTTAGFDRESICWEQYEHARKVLADPAFDPAYYAWIREAAEGADHTDPEVWAAVNPSYGTITHEPFYRDQLTKQPENEYRRFYMNQWTLAADCWLPAGSWSACEGPETIPDGAPVWAAVDMSLYHDSTAVALVHPLDDGRFVARARVWRPKDAGGAVDHLEVMDHLRQVAGRYRLQEGAYDPRFFEVPSQMLSDEGLPMVEIPQSPERMVPACGMAFELITGGRVVHDGDPVLADHVLSAAQRPSERGWMLSKSKSGRHIDACVALVMALWRASLPPVEKPRPRVRWV